MLDKLNLKSLYETSFANINLKDLLEKIMDKNLSAIYSSHLNQKDKLSAFFNNLNTNKKVKIVAIPSISLPSEILENIVGINHYESRSLWETLRVTNDERLLGINKNIEILFITSQKVHQDYIDHLFQLSKNKNILKTKVKFLSLNDISTNKSLTHKILEDRKIIEKIKEFIKDENAIIHPFMTSEAEDKLANILDIPYWGIHPSLQFFQTKSGNKRIINDANVPQTFGYTSIKSLDQLLICLESLWEKNTSLKKIMLKLDQGVSGDGNAILTHNMAFEEFYELTLLQKREYLLSRLENMKFQSKKLDWEIYQKRMKSGSIIEEFIDNQVYSSPSCQACILPSGNVEIYSTHEQILDKNGQTFLGCVFPAKKSYRAQIQEHTSSIGKKLMQNGVIGPYSVDFLVTKDNLDFSINAIEINIRQGGTTHPLQTTKMLTRSHYDEAKGTLITENKERIQYLSTDNVINEKLKEKKPHELIKFIKNKGLLFNPQKNKGTVFHLIGAMNEFGKIGYITIGKNSSEIKTEFNKIRKLIEEFSKM